MADETLSNVRALAAAGEKQKFALHARIVNFDALVKFPAKFYYEGCTIVVDDDTTCARSLEGHKHCAELNHTGSIKMFKFNVHLADSNTIAQNLKPLRVITFDVASQMLRITPEDLSIMEHHQQYSFVHNYTTQMQLFNVVLRCKDLGVTLLSLTPIQESSNTQGTRSLAIYVSPFRSRVSSTPADSEFHTPVGIRESSNTPVISTPAAYVPPGKF